MQLDHGMAGGENFLPHLFQVILRRDEVAVGVALLVGFVHHVHVQAGDLDLGFGRLLFRLETDVQRDRRGGIGGQRHLDAVVVRRGDHQHDLALADAGKEELAVRPGELVEHFVRTGLKADMGGVNGLARLLADRPGRRQHR